jgi:Uma2 family endonuclease
MALDTQKLTYEAFLTLPETKQRYEVIEGEMFLMSPGPTPEHQRIVLNLSLQLAPFVREHQLGELFIAPLDVLITRTPLQVRQPDVLFVSNAHLDIIGPQQIEGGPDLVVEILSPANTRAAMDAKLHDYWRVGVQECWLISPEARTIEVLQRGVEHFERSGLYGLGDMLASRILPDLSLRLEDIW